MERLRFDRERRSANRDVIGIGAIARRISHRENLVAFFKLRYAKPDFLHHARDVPAGNERKLVLDEPIQRTGTYFPIERVDASGMNVDEHFAFLHLWAWRIIVLQDLRSAVTVKSDCVHKFWSPISGRRARAFNRLNDFGKRHWLLLDKVLMASPS